MDFKETKETFVKGIVKTIIDEELRIKLPQTFETCS